MKTLVVWAKSVFAGSLILVNGAHPYREGSAKRLLVPVREDRSSILMERGAAVLLAELMSTIDGWAQIEAVSGWRSYHEQQELFDRSLKENGETFTRQFVATPGCSEHQTGLAIDLGIKKPQIDYLRPDFPYDGICQTFRERAAAYGFIERYPAGKESVTKIAQEPWHFRYVGAPHAAIMKELGLTLEEYHDFLKQYPLGKRSFSCKSANQTIEVSYIKAAMTNTEIEIEPDLPYCVSGNNMDGFVLTKWRACNAPK